MNFIVHHMQRSCGHAFIDWLGKSLGKPFLHVNDLINLAITNNEFLTIERYAKLCKAFPHEHVITSIEDCGLNEADARIINIATFCCAPYLKDAKHIIVVRNLSDCRRSRIKFHMTCVLGDDTSEFRFVRNQHYEAACRGKHRAIGELTGVFVEQMQKHECRQRIAQELHLPGNAQWPKHRVVPSSFEE